MSIEPLYSYSVNCNDNKLYIDNIIYETYMFDECFQMVMRKYNKIVLNKYIDFIYTNLHSNITELDLTITNNDNVNLNILPSNLKKLEILVSDSGGNSIFKIPLDNLPLTLETLIIHTSKLEVSLDYLPMSLKILSIRINNHKAFLDNYGLNNLPQSLTQLYIYTNYAPVDRLTVEYLIEKILNLPENIEKFHISCHIFDFNPYYNLIYEKFRNFFKSKYVKFCAGIFKS